MRLLVTGLCLQGNKGGPALAMSLRARLLERLPGAEIVFSVPGGDELAHEERWARRYGVEVVANSRYGAMARASLGRGGSDDAEAARRWLEAARGADAVVDLCAISYVGPPAGTERFALLKSRAHYFAMARFLRRPFLAWTQSYGPFSTAAIRAVARLDLRRQPIVLCRGDDCAAAVRVLLPGKEVRSYPDVATTLGYDRAWGAQYAARLLGDPESRAFATVSPSAMLYNRSPGAGSQNGHVRDVRQLVVALRARGLAVVLLPHTLRLYRPNPHNCDLAVCRLVLAELAPDAGVTLVEDDLSARELKSVLSVAHVHVGARYHSVVGALSSGVPAIALSWHAKYRDVLRAYGREGDVVDGSDPERVLPLVDAVLAERERAVEGLLAAHGRVVAAVAENADLFADLLSEAVA